ncbi:MAG: NAD(P)/FAD-dependent oxidoreductase [Flavobacteriales bacterium]
MVQVVIIGGGAAGFFCAANILPAPDVSIRIVEKSSKTLAKVKISGGGRCNVTHACFEPKELVKFYPRGARELLGPFHTFQPGDVFDWFHSRGVELKTEDDNRVFPITDKSQTIIDALESAVAKNNVRVDLNTGITAIKKEDQGYELTTDAGTTIRADYLVISAGSSPQFWSLLSKTGFPMIQQVPSLFTFNIKHPIIDGLAGISVPWAEVSIEKSNFTAQGPLLITHWGLSGPGILKLSAWAARSLEQVNYAFKIKVNWLGNEDFEDAISALKNMRDLHPKKLTSSQCPFGLVSRLWNSMLVFSGIEQKNWADVSNKKMEELAQVLTAFTFHVNGKSTFKDEFVTAGGVDLKSINFKTMESKDFPNVFLAGEVLDIDAVTGGFNFQAAWTTAWIAAKSISERVHSQKSC